MLRITLYHRMVGLSRKGQTNHKGSCQSIFFILKTDYIHLKTSYMDERACSLNATQLEQVPFLRGQTVWEKLIKEINIARQRVFEKDLREIECSDNSTGCLEKIF